MKSLKSIEVNEADETLDLPASSRGSVSLHSSQHSDSGSDTDLPVEVPPPTDYSSIWLLGSEQDQAWDAYSPEPSPLAAPLEFGASAAWAMTYAASS